MNAPPLEVKVWAPMAAFVRPEHRVERVSYPLPTPSAARGVLEAIFWKPEFEYRIRDIAVLKPIRYVGFLRNEVNVKASGERQNISITDERSQRHTLALRDVAYIIRADVAVRPGVEHDPAKYRDQFRRRVARGQYYHHPYLGCREFACDFGEPDGNEQPIADSRDLGLMLFDLAFGKGEKDPATPIFFPARLEAGVLHVPDSLYAQREGVMAS
jgi:CRISPR-associated protein Cas5, subtype I-C/DVULG